MTEVWKDIAGYEGLYQVSNLGRVKSLPRELKRFTDRKCLAKERILTAHPNSKGYLRIQLKKDGKTEQRFLHRLVAEAFIPNPSNKGEVNHIDNAPTNNKAENLEWTTHKENMEWSSKCGRYDHLKEQRSKYGKMNISKARKCVERKVCLIDENGNVIKEYSTLTDACKDYGLDGGGVCRCCQGKQKTCGGYRWRYYDKDTRKDQGDNP